MARVPYWLEKNCYILRDNEETLVKYYYNEAGGELVVNFDDGSSEVFDEERMKPLPAISVPDFVKPGKAVQLDDPFDDDDDGSSILRVVEGTYQRKAYGDEVGVSKVKLVGFNPMDADTPRKVPEAFGEKADVIEESYAEGLKINPKYFLNMTAPPPRGFGK
jgi:hypothetical protein